MELKMKKLAISLAVILGCSTAAFAVDAPGQEQSAKQYAPGQMKQDNDAQSAKQYAPGQMKDDENGARDQSAKMGEDTGTKSGDRSKTSEHDTNKTDQHERQND
jgi:hypothetical protein